MLFIYYIVSILIDLIYVEKTIKMHKKFELFKVEAFSLTYNLLIKK